MSLSPLRPGDPERLGGFSIEAFLGEGGQGAVYLGRAAGGEPVAVKVLHHSADPDARVRLARELSAIQQVAPFCTARVIDADLDGAQPYIVSEYVDGPSLKDRVDRSGPLSGGELDRLAVGTASALAAIHAAGVVHRDFKPHNVLLGPDGPRVVDFGIARAVDTPTITQGVIGTPGYVSPEQLREEGATGASDMFAWAATMAFAATGRAPFGGGSVAAILGGVLHKQPSLDGVPAPLRSILELCLAKDPSGRPSSREVMMRLVDPSAAGMPVATEGGAAEQTASPKPGGLPDQTIPGRRGRRWAVAAIGGAIAVLAAAVVLVVLQPGFLGPSAGPTPGSTTDQPQPPTGTAPATGLATEPAEDAIAVPADFAGTWRGEVAGNAGGMSSSDDPVVLALPSGERRGTWNAPGDDPGCETANITPLKVEGSTLKIRIDGFPGGSCAAAQMVVKGELKLKGDDIARLDATIGNAQLPAIGSMKGDLTRS